MTVGQLKLRRIEYLRTTVVKRRKKATDDGSKEKEKIIKLDLDLATDVEVKNERTERRKNRSRDLATDVEVKNERTERRKNHREIKQCFF